MKKGYPGLLSIILLLTFVLAACSGGGDGTSRSSGASGSAAANLTEAGTYPIVKEKTTLKVMVRGNPLVEDFETNEFTKWYEEKTNVHIEWEVVPEQSLQEKLNLVLAGGDYPDVILGLNVPPSQQMIYGSEGTFIALNDLIEKYGVQTKKLFADKPEVKKAITAPDGSIYSLPEINECYHCSMNQKMWIYKPWLDKLGLDVPTTTGEFYDVLMAFKTRDPNGNGKADEVPLSITNQAWGSPIDAYLMNSFIYNPMYGDTKHLFVKDGKLDVAYNKPEWKEGLRYLNKLYEDGLLTSESFTQDNNQLIQLGENPDTVLLGASTGGTTAAFTQLLGDSGRWAEYVTVPPLEGPAGVRYAPNDPAILVPGTFIITDKAENPEVAFRWADGLYEYEHTLRSNYGRPDTEWREAEADELGINGEPAKWAEVEPFGKVQNVHWAQTGPSLRSNEFRLSAVAKEDNDLEVILYNETKNNYEPYKPTDVSSVPPLFMTNEQATESADLAKTINDYVDEMMARFVLGDADLDKDWDTYVKTLDNMNLGRLIEIYQEAYSAMQ
ncbi:ABC transporter substrate-binding protein [Cohnella algarum]|uniref:ABC transporter substrate-binding protein n=1 Tax=Cohnella algarum TaxID=2044859 RepID=UPI001967633B|nr:ABC transporter substrate-binding protein [Cohnella algarum]MBN2981469.1 ABC transporter substrate-binding protein [Cohnella algarum]